MDIKELWAQIKLIFSDLWPIIWPTLKTILTANGRMALQAALNIVKNVQETMPTASGTDKAAAALAQLTAALAVQGVAMGTEMLRAIIKIAYEHMIAEPAVIEEAKAMMLSVSVTEATEIIPDWVK